jgi:hypothetical protein
MMSASATSEHVQNGHYFKQIEIDRLNINTQGGQDAQ